MIIGATSAAVAGSITSAFLPPSAAVSRNAKPWMTSQRPVRLSTRALAVPVSCPAAMARALLTTVSSSVGMGNGVGFVAAEPGERKLAEPGLGRVVERFEHAGPVKREQPGGIGHLGGRS